MRLSGSAAGLTMRCSFCGITEKPGLKLISSPSDNPRAYICSECVDVCGAIVAEDRPPAPEPEPPEPGAPHPLLTHPLASELMERLVEWLRLESVGGEAGPAFVRMRETAARMLSDTAR